MFEGTLGKSGGMIGSLASTPQGLIILLIVIAGIAAAAVWLLIGFAIILAFIWTFAAGVLFLAGIYVFIFKMKPLWGLLLMGLSVAMYVFMG